MVYCEIVPFTESETNRSPPDIAMPVGDSNPVTSEALTVAPIGAVSVAVFDNGAGSRRRR